MILPKNARIGLENLSGISKKNLREARALTALYEATGYSATKTGP
jgi:hypothetical protein